MLVSLLIFALSALLSYKLFRLFFPGFFSRDLIYSHENAGLRDRDLTDVREPRGYNVHEHNGMSWQIILFEILIMNVGMYNETAVVKIGMCKTRRV